MADTLELNAGQVTVEEIQTNAVFTREDGRNCACCGNRVIGKGYGEGSSVYHTRKERDYMHEALCCGI